MPRRLTWALPLYALLLTACPAPSREIPGPNTPTADLQPSLDRFQTAWNTGARADITAFMARDLRKRKSQLLRKLFRRHDWEAKRPAITFESRDSVVAHQVAIFWTLEGQEKVMQTDWQWEADAWWLLDLKLRIRK
ncbi:MAG: hypothetical protein P1V36_01885 [Planctomycetota bacterium]|nr:hypothetical protein [Planctomycetota bacterium]